LKKSFAIISIALALAPASLNRAFAQETFTAIPKDIATQYHFNFPRNFFASPQSEKTSRFKFYNTLKALQAMKGKVASSADSLYKTLVLNDQANAEFMPHYIYLYLRYATNTKDETSRDEQAKFGAEFTEKTSFLQQELMLIDDKTLARFIVQKPDLKKYSYEIETARRLRPHTLSLKEEELLGATGPLMTDWQGQLYQRSLDRTTFGKVQAPNGELDVWKQQTELINSSDREARKQGHLKIYEGYKQQRDLFAFAITKLVRARNQVSQLHHYKDNPTDVYFNIFLTVPEVKGLFEKLAQSADTIKRYQQMRADHIKKISGYDDVNVWDLSFVPPGFQRPRFTIEETSKTIKEALAPFGPEYARELNALLNPANGRLDIVGGDNRVPGAFSWGFPGSQISIFYSFNFEGYYSDVDTLIHEAGHAVHNQFMANNHVLPAYAGGPNYFTESFAMFNELMLGDYLYRKETDPMRKTWFLERFLGSAFAVYGVAEQAGLEQAMYDGVAAGKLKTADDFDALAKQNGMRYSIWFGKHDELKEEWIDIHHYYDNPMYYVNYVFAQMLALKYYEMYTKDPKGFVPRYLNLVRNGFNAPPTVLLKKFLNLDIKDPKLASDAVSVIQPRIEELAKLYNR
jgi:oligoendopeptidase F